MISTAATACSARVSRFDPSASDIDRRTFCLAQNRRHQLRRSFDSCASKINRAADFRCGTDVCTLIGPNAKRIFCHVSAASKTSSSGLVKSKNVGDSSDPPETIPLVRDIAPKEKTRAAIRRFCLLL